MYYIGKLGKRNDGAPSTAFAYIFGILAIPTFLYVMHSYLSHPYNPNDFLMRFSWWRTHDFAVFILREVIAFAVLFAVVFFVVNIVALPFRDRVYAWYESHYGKTAFASQTGVSLLYFNHNGSDVSFRKKEIDRTFQVSAQLERCFPNASIYIGLNCSARNHPQETVDVIMILGNKLFLFTCYPYYGEINGSLDSANWMGSGRHVKRNEFKYLADRSTEVMYALHRAGVPFSGFESINLIVAGDYNLTFNISQNGQSQPFRAIESDGRRVQIPINTYCVHADIHTRELPELIRTIVPEGSDAQSNEAVEKAKEYLNSCCPAYTKTTGGFGKAYEK